MNKLIFRLVEFGLVVTLAVVIDSTATAILGGLLLGGFWAYDEMTELK